MAKEFATHTSETAPEAARSLLGRVQREYGYIPNVYAKMAESPALLEACLEADRIFETRANFTALEKHAILQTANRINGCTYCLAAHSYGAIRTKECPGETDHRLQRGEPTGDARLDALCRFVAHLIDRRGWADDAELAAFFATGFTRAQALDVVLATALKAMTNHANHLTHPEIDARYRPDAAAE
ncbi:MAG: hypothetical protein SGJ07_13350 [Rhodospirillaceae bacterium]|nr:hypothetical protein [Rhodospirillaceae bacterium]